MNNESQTQVTPEAVVILKAATNHVRLLQLANEDALKRNKKLRMELDAANPESESYECIRKEYYRNDYRIKREDERITGEWRMLYRIAKSMDYALLYSKDNDSFELKLLK